MPLATQVLAEHPCSRARGFPLYWRFHQIDRSPQISPPEPTMPLLKMCPMLPNVTSMDASFWFMWFRWYFIMRGHYYVIWMLLLVIYALYHMDIRCGFYYVTDHGLTYVLNVWNIYCVCFYWFVVSVWGVRGWFFVTHYGETQNVTILLHRCACICWIYMCMYVLGDAGLEVQGIDSTWFHKSERAYIIPMEIFWR